MRFLLEVLIIGALIYAGWEKPFRDQLPSVVAGALKPAATPAAEVTPTPAPQLRPIVRTAPTPSGAWMWDANHRSVLDASPSKSPH